MVLSQLLAHDSAVGVDIGSSSIKLVHAEPTKNGVRISHIAMCPTPPDSVKEGVVVNIPEVADAIQFALRSAGIKTYSAVTAIAGPGVVVRHVQVPRMTEQVFRKTIGFDAGRYISSAAEDSIVEFEIIGESDDHNQMNVLIVAAPKNIVDSKVAAIEQAGLDPISVDVEAFCTFRTLVDYGSDASLRQGTIALLDIGASHTEINLVCNGKLELTRTIPIAGRSLSNAIKNAESCTDEEAEQIKRSMDMSELIGLPAGSATSQSLKVVQSLVDEVLKEVRRSVNFYQSQLQDGTVDMTVSKLVLTGGTSRLKGLQPYANSRLNVEVTTGNPALCDMIHLSPSHGEVSDEDVSLLAVAFGLAVKELPASARLAYAA